MLSVIALLEQRQQMLQAMRLMIYLKKLKLVSKRLLVSQPSFKRSIPTLTKR